MIWPLNLPGVAAAVVAAAEAAAVVHHDYSSRLSDI